jgi:glycosyltransferase involved in cell wall biosynthesis
MDRDPDLAQIEAGLDHAMYRQVAGEAARDDPALHYHAEGWRLGHNPNTWFDTAWYLRRYPDIAEAGIDPFLHYLAHGAAEGRMARAPTGHAAAILAGGIAPGDRRPGYDAPADARRLTGEAFGAALADEVAGAAGLVVAVSHDRYIDVTGGMQVLIAEEQALFADSRVTYLHISPAVSRLTLAGPGAEFALLQVVLQDRFLGLIVDTELAAALASLVTSALDTASAEQQAALPRALVVHSIFGHRIASLAALAAALRPQQSYFWLHDYASLCEGFNLLRNELSYCHAPPVGSMACRVCIHGDNRAAYLEAVHRLFVAVPFHVLAPSRATLEIWLLAGAMPWQTALVHANARLGAPRPIPPRGMRGSAADPVRVAFAGYPMSHKGWPAFLELLHATRGMVGYRFHHFAAAETLPALDGLVSVAANVTVTDRQAMSRALERHEIDLLLVLSPWPETFSYVAHEGLAAGADLVALDVGGNVPDIIRGEDRGVVLADAAALLAYFTSGAAVASVRAREAAGRFGCDLVGSGGTATLDPATLHPADLTQCSTEDPALVMLADGRPLEVLKAGPYLRVALPGDAAVIRLRSRRQFRGLETSPGDLAGDIAAIERSGSVAGLALDALSLDGAPIPPGDRRRGRGWHDLAGGVIWTDGDASLHPGGAAVLELRLNPSARYWRAPLTIPPPPPRPASTFARTNPLAASC